MQVSRESALPVWPFAPLSIKIQRPHKISQICELENFGFTNMVFDTERNFMNFATTRGVFHTWHTWAHGGLYAKREMGSSRDRLVTELGHSIRGVYGHAAHPFLEDRKVPFTLRAREVVAGKNFHKTLWKA